MTRWHHSEVKSGTCSHINKRHRGRLFMDQWWIWTAELNNCSTSSTTVNSVIVTAKDSYLTWSLNYSFCHNNVLLFKFHRPPRHIILQELLLTSRTNMVTLEHNFLTSLTSAETRNKIRWNMNWSSLSNFTLKAINISKGSRFSHI